MTAPVHLRARIRAAVVALLKDADIEGVGDRVFATRIHPLQRDALPAICVYTAAQPETAELATTARHLQRSLPLIVEIHTRSADQVDDLLDGLAAAVEIAMEADPRFGRLAITSWLSATVTGFSGEGERAGGLARLTYTVVCRTAAGQPGVAG